MLTKEKDDLEVKLTDFGLAHFDNNQLRMHRICGSPGYVAPEILKGQGANCKSDIFSIGVTFYNLLTGRELFYNSDLNVLIH